MHIVPTCIYMYTLLCQFINRVVLVGFTQIWLPIDIDITQVYTYFIITPVYADFMLIVFSLKIYILMLLLYKLH